MPQQGQARCWPRPPHARRPTPPPGSAQEWDEQVLRIEQLPDEHVAARDGRAAGEVGRARAPVQRCAQRRMQAHRGRTAPPNLLRYAAPFSARHVGCCHTRKNCRAGACMLNGRACGSQDATRRHISTRKDRCSEEGQEHAGMRRFFVESQDSLSDLNAQPCLRCEAHADGTKVGGLQHADAGPEHSRDAHTHAQRPHALLHSGAASTVVAKDCLISCAQLSNHAITQTQPPQSACSQQKR